jgi:hypothetical protein
MRPGEQVRDVLHARARHLRPEQEAGAVLGIDPEQSAVLQHHAAAALVAEVDRANREVQAGGPQGAVGLADAGDVRVGEDNGKRRPPEPGADVRKPSGVLAGNAALVGRLVQQWYVAVGVPGDEDVAVAALHGEAVEARHALVVKLEGGVLKAEAGEVRPAAGGGQQVVEALGPVSALAPVPYGDRVAVARDRPDLSVRVEGQLVADRGEHRGPDLGIGQHRDRSALPKDAHAHPEARQRLPELEPDHPGSEHGAGLRQVLPVEQVVVDDDAVAEPGEFGGAARPRPGGDDDPPRFDAIAPVELQRMAVEKAHPPADPRARRPGADGVHHESDEAIPFPAHALHDRPSIDADRTADQHAEALGARRLVGRVRRGDQQLRRHASHQRTGRAIACGLDQQHVRGMGTRRPVGSHPRRSCTDDGDVNCSGHGCTPFLFVHSGAESRDYTTPLVPGRLCGSDHEPLRNHGKQTFLQVEVSNPSRGLLGGAFDREAGERLDEGGPAARQHGDDDVGERPRHEDVLGLPVPGRAGCLDVHPPDAAHRMARGHDAHRGMEG